MDEDDSVLLLLFNCFISREEMQRANRNPLRSVVNALNLPPGDWPAVLAGIEFRSCRALTVPLQPGLSTEDRTSNMLMNLVVLGKTGSITLPVDVLLCRAETGHKHPLLRFRRASVVVVHSCQDMLPFSSWPCENTFGIHDLSKLESIGFRLVDALHRPAVPHRHDVCDHMCYMKKQSMKPYERELERATEVLKNLQLWKQNQQPEVALANALLQLGFSDVLQWRESKDPCMSRRKGLPGLLTQSCRCGQLSWKVRLAAGVRLSESFPPMHWLGVLQHQIKEQVAQRFLSGAIILERKADVELVQEGIVFSILQMKDELDGSSDQPNVRLHLWF